MRYYVEFGGPSPTDEIGACVEANNPDDAIPAARAQVAAELASSPGDDDVRDRLGDVTPFEFATWRVDICRPGPAL